MFAMLSKIEVTKKGLISRIFNHFIEITIFKTTISLRSDAFDFVYCFPCSPEFEIRVKTEDEKKIDHVIFGERDLSFEYDFPKLKIKLFVSLRNSTFDFYLNKALSSQTCHKAVDAGTRTKAKKTADLAVSEQDVGGTVYFVNEETFETSFSKTFKSQLVFPSFRKITQNGRTFYADDINKMVIGIRPLEKLNNIKDSIRYSLFDRAGISMPFKICIRRNNIIESSIRKFLPTINKYNIMDVIVVFENEIGEDHGAMKLEFLNLLFNELMTILIKDKKVIGQNSEGIVDVLPKNQKEPSMSFLYNYDENKHLKEEILNDLINDLPACDTKKYLILLGATIGSFLLLGETFKMNFSLSFYENLIDRKFTLRHVQDAELQRNLYNCYCKEQSTTSPNRVNTCKTFKQNSEFDFTDSQAFATPENLDKIVSAILFDPKINQYDFIRFGYKCAIKDALFTLTAFDFPFLFCHFMPISLETIQNIVIYEKCGVKSKEICWLWEILKEKQQNFRSKFLSFITGSENLGVLDENTVICFEKVSTVNEMFRATVCSRRLYIPSFDSKDLLEYYLDYSVLNTEGFHKI